jgi:hypothetical protein
MSVEVMKTGIAAVALTMAAAGVAIAQTPATEAAGTTASADAAPTTPATGTARAQQIQARFQILAMEGVLERAVQLGAQRVRAQVQAVAPDMLFITGAARARGFWLDGYGVFFDVDVPAMRRSLAWTFRVLEQSDRGLEVTLAALKRQLSAVEDPAVRRSLMESLQQLESRVTTTAPPTSAGAGMRTVTSEPAEGTRAVAARDPERSAVLEDPGAAYTTHVKDALINAMIEYSAPIPIQPNECLTIAARDQDGSRLQPGDPYEVSTILLRVKGSDLAAYRTGQIDRDEVQRRVEVKEY